MISKGYFQQEVDFRSKCGFPPFVHLVLITVRCAHQERGRFTAETIARRLKEGLPEGATLGDAVPAPLEKAEGAVPLPAIAAREVGVQAEPARPRGTGEDATAHRRDRGGGRRPVPTPLRFLRFRGSARRASHAPGPSGPTVALPIQKCPPSAGTSSDRRGYPRIRRCPEAALPFPRP